MGNMRGIVLMTASMALFAVEDMLIKIVAQWIPVGQILVVLGLGGALLFAAMVVARGQALFPRALLHRSVILRNLGEIVGTIGFVTAIALTPLSTAASILQAMPLVVTMGAALFLGEPVGWRRWSAIFVGFAGVLLIIRPGMAGFEAASLFAVLGVLGLSVRDLATRVAPAQISALQLSAHGFAMVVPAGALMLVVGPPPVALHAAAMAYLALGIFVGAAGYYAITAAMRLGAVAVVTPFRYSRIVFAMIIGIAVFDERPDTATLAGAALIVASGLFTFWREARALRPRPGGNSAPHR